MIRRDEKGKFKKQRKIIQISAVEVENGPSTQCSVLLYALCKDGTVWVKRDWVSGPQPWMREPTIPQPGEEGEQDE